MDQGLRNFLMKTSYLPAMTSRMAEDLTGNVRAKRILSDLSRQNLFTVGLQRSPVQYQYHPLFTDYLRARAREHFTAEDLGDLEIDASRILAGSGQVEAAVGLLVEARAWENVVELILTQAQTMVKMGRIQTLLGWIDSVPDQVKEEVPWLSYWKGVCCFQMAKPDCMEWTEKAYLGFRERGDRDGVFLSLAGICESGFYLWQDFSKVDHWVDELNKLLEEDGEFPSQEIEGMVVFAVLICLIYKIPYPKDIDIWKDRALYLVRNSPDVGLRIRINCVLANFYNWTGDFENYTACLHSVKRDEENVEISPFDRTHILIFESMHNWLTGDIGGCRESVNKGLEFIADTGMYAASPYLICQMIYAALSSGEAEEAGRYIAGYREMFHPANQLHSAHYHFLAGWMALVQGDLRQAVSEMELGDKIGTEANLPFPNATNKIGLVNCYIENDNHDRANEILHEANAIAERMESGQLKFMCQTGWAYLALKKGDEKALLKHLELMMVEGKKYVFPNSPNWLPPVMSQLCAKALEYGIEVDYVRNLISKRKLVPPVDSLQGLDNWPWPVRIATLGSFELVRDDEPVRFSGKAQRRPMDLLKALIAFGGREVSSDRLMDSLWPDSDGDMARNSFNAALHRLRKLVGIKDALTLQDGRLSLDPGYCRVDLWAFEDACGVADAAFRDGQPGENFPAMAKRAMALFGGRFLPDDLNPWAISTRERMRNRYSRIVTRLGRYLEGAGDHDGAIDCYLQALDIDDLAEEVYTSLMGCYEALGRRADAVALYKRCRRTLLEVLGVEPSPEIDAIYRRIRT